MFERVGVFILVFVLHVIVFHVIIHVAILYMNYPRYGDCEFSASFVRECTDVSYVAGGGVEGTVRNEGCRGKKGSVTHEISSCAIYL